MATDQRAIPGGYSAPRGTSGIAYSRKGYSALSEFRNSPESLGFRYSATAIPELKAADFRNSPDSVLFRYSPTGRRAIWNSPLHLGLRGAQAAPEVRGQPA